MIFIDYKNQILVDTMWPIKKIKMSYIKPRNINYNVEELKFKI